ncbi:MAG: hypothetical protein EOP49_33710, partial [Sphingobacteriales bacterium]
MTFKISLLIGFILASQVGFGQKPSVYSTVDGAVAGYDVVAYFYPGAAIKGFDSLSYNYEGAVWKFASRANLDSFRTSPQRFLPKNYKRSLA